MSGAALQAWALLRCCAVAALSAAAGPLTAVEQPQGAVSGAVQLWR